MVVGLGCDCDGCGLWCVIVVVICCGCCCGCCSSGYCFASGLVIVLLRYVCGSEFVGFSLFLCNIEVCLLHTSLWGV